MRRTHALVLATVLACACGDAPAPAPDAAAPGGEDAGAHHDLAPPEDGSPPAHDGAGADAGPTGVPFVYVSGYAPRIDRLRLDPKTGALTSLGNTTAAGNPSFLAIDGPRRRLYALNEATAGTAQAYSIDPATGALASLGTARPTGNGPAHIALHPAGAHALVANYGDGTVAVLPLDATLALLPATDTRAVGANAHQILPDPPGQAIYVPCKGADRVAQLSLDPQTGKLAPLAPAEVTTAMGAGPRHLAIHPNGQTAYLINELASTMTALTRDAAGRLTPVQTLPTRAAGAAGINTAAEVVVHPSGAFLYGSNRGDDNLVLYALDGQGRMTLKGHTPSGGKTPRSFAIDPSGRWLISANQGSGVVVVFAIDPATGALTPTPYAAAAAQPAFVGVVILPGAP